MANRVPGRSFCLRGAGHTSETGQSQRDVAIQVPINYVTQPGISLSAACFGEGRYEDRGLQDCVSNLMSVGFRRLIIDLYWDAARQVWSFCPVSVPMSSSAATSTLSSTAGLLATAQLQTAALLPSTSSQVAQTASTRSTSLVARQATSNSSTSSALLSSASSIPPNSTSSTQPLSTVITSPSEEPLYQFGPYQCTSTIEFTNFINLLSNYIQSTENTIDAHPIHLIINVHAAAATGNPAEPAMRPEQSALPGTSNSLSSLLDASLSAYIYTPTELSTHRANLNSSWYSVVPSRQPLSAYYTTKIASNHVHSTPDGWPSESFIETAKAKRLLIGYGSTDPQMQDYNFSSDWGTIFPQGYMESGRDLRIQNDGIVNGGCFFDADTFDLARVNSSWSMSSNFTGLDYPTAATSPPFPLLNLTSNLTACGISPTINETLTNTTADTNITSYQAMSYATVWSWAYGEPRNSSGNTSDNDDKNSHFRCALMDPILNGRWRVGDCTTKYYAACRIASEPYQWQISADPVAFSAAPDVCSGNSTFAVPRTALENTYLYSALKARPDVSSNSDTNGVWLQFHSLDIETCWVSGGSNASCPYHVDAVSEQRRAVLVPTIAAVIVLVLTALTLLVKCNQNRRTSKTRTRRTEGGWDYEGVPS